jgi:hypothetical protein
MDDLERFLRAKMGDANFVVAYRSAFGRLRADRPMGDFPLHSVTLRYVQSILEFQESYYNGDDEPTVTFMPFGAPGVRTPEPDSQRILQESMRPQSSNGYSESNSGSNNSNSNSNNSCGCYIATSVYGSYDCPQVWILRRYRDNTLAITWYGRLFIRIYYAISPTLVKWFGNTMWFRHIWRNKLDKFVNRLQQEGVQNTPYQD